MIQQSSREILNTHFMWRLSENATKKIWYRRTGHNDNIVRRMLFACWIALTTLETSYSCFSYMHFVLICTVVVLYCFVVCVCACVCMSGFCNVWVFLIICILYSDWGFFNLTEVFLTLTELFTCFFLSCKANARVKPAKTGHGPHSSIVFVLLGCYYLCCSVVIYVVLCIVCV